MGIFTHIIGSVQIIRKIRTVKIFVVNVLSLFLRKATIEKFNYHCSITCQAYSDKHQQLSLFEP